MKWPSHYWSCQELVEVPAVGACERHSTKTASHRAILWEWGLSSRNNHPTSTNFHLFQSPWNSTKNKKQNRSRCQSFFLVSSFSWATETLPYCVYPFTPFLYFPLCHSCSLRVAGRWWKVVIHLQQLSVLCWWTLYMMRGAVSQRRIGPVNFNKFKNLEAICLEEGVQLALRRCQPTVIRSNSCIVSIFFFLNHKNPFQGFSIPFSVIFSLGPFSFWQK